VELLINLVVLRLRPRGQCELLLMLAILATRTAESSSFLFLIQGVDDVFIRERLVGLVVLCVLQENLVHVCAGVLVQLVAAGEDDEGDLAVAQDGQLVRLLHHPELPLVECYLSIPLVGDS